VSGDWDRSLETSSVIAQVNDEKNGVNGVGNLSARGEGDSYGACESGPRKI